MSRIPFVDLRRAFEPIQSEIREAIDRVLEKQDFVLGEEVEQFERRFAAYCGAQHCVTVATGTAALQLALLGSGIRPGDEVITQPNTYFATVAAIMNVGARPVFADVAPPEYSIDLEAVEAAITPRTRAIVCVHLFGQPCDVDALAAIATKYHLLLIEDASQAHGAVVREKRIGSRSDTVATFSFYPSKNLGALGEGGCVLTADAAIAERIRMLRNHGSSNKFVHEMVGQNERLDTLKAAVLLVKLRHLDGWLTERRQIAARYDALLPELERPLVKIDMKHAFHLYPILVSNRDELRRVLLERGVETSIHYPVPCHLQRAAAGLCYVAGDFPNAENLARRELSLPVYPGLTDDEIQRVAANVEEFAARG
ncbi:MAG: DegT/DnrJ/EryC1/StrS family aminotransferase [Candidatus Eremiobacteraeota bacterium]|nr:DegT/DnrJ/EryC1/StrS family aminotransferase [Candidatus Eremiobacteraeota bacterium]